MPRHWIEATFRAHGHTHYSGEREEAVSALEHGLQCAMLAERQGASPALIIAALVHDIGHMAGKQASRRDDVDDRHELIGARLLAREMPPEVSEPVRLHVAAKRYLCAIEPDYFAALSPASVHSLELQGGPMKADECRAYEAERFAQDGIRLRRWDELGKQPGLATPSLGHFLALIDKLV
ncbi:MAG: HD domain-containing protein [Burkholderiaceae bacterium]